MTAGIIAFELVSTEWHNSLWLSTALSLFKEHCVLAGDWHCELLQLSRCWGLQNSKKQHHRSVEIMCEQN